MATFIWNGLAAGNWNVDGNWAGGLPASGGDVLIGAGTQTVGIGVTEDATVSINSLTLAGRSGKDASGVARTTTLAVTNGGTLTVGTLNFDNRSIIDGAGSLAVNGAITGGGAITATGGVLEIGGSGFIANAADAVLSISNAAPSTLEINLSGGVTSGAIKIGNVNQTLEIGPQGSLTIVNAPEQVNHGSILMAGGTLTVSQGIQFGGGGKGTGTLSGSGIVAADLTASGGSGIDTITASGGTLEVTGTFGAGLAGVIGAGSTLRFDSTVGTTNLSDTQPTVTFDSSATGGSGTLDLTHISLANFHGIVDNFVVGDKIDVLGAASVSFTGTTLNVLDSGGVSLGAIALGESHAGATFSIDSSTGAITTTFPCFAAGTHILTATGERTVETLLQGDIVLTLTGEELSAHPVKWIGRRRIDLTAHPRPETAAPIRIRRGAFADNMPHSDLLVSPDHAIFVDGKLICARQLVNGTTILHEKGRTSVEYFHVELDAHSILLAEGLPAESYLNTGNRGFFANASEPLLLHPDLTDETDYPARETGSCAPFASDEASVRPVWQRLAERAATLGEPVPTLDTTTDPELHIVVKGQTQRPQFDENGLHIFVLPKGTTEVRLVSRAGSPTDVRPWLEDHRCLGVYVEGIVLRGASGVRNIALDHPGLSQGWWAVERDGTAQRRWTNGDAVLSLPASQGPTMLEIRAGSSGIRYVTDAKEDRQAA